MDQSMKKLQLFGNSEQLLLTGKKIITNRTECFHANIKVEETFGKKVKRFVYKPLSFCHNRRKAAQIKQKITLVIWY